jgi:hypothetical protein
MNHLSDDRLSLLYYGEEAADAHFEECPECRERYDSLRRVLAAVEMPVPERGAAYGSEVWSRVEPHIGERHMGERPWRFLARAAAALVLLLGGAFEAGRLYQVRRQPAQVLDSGTAERVLLAAVGDYLERSQIVLIELANADPNAARDISLDQERARDLVAENRLYRQTAERTGQAGIASLLEELERVLLEIEHAPSTMPPEELKQLRHRLRDDGILFKMRVVGANVEEL